MESITKTIDTLLKENTGVELCDSGGEDGRSWQKNQSRNFNKESKYTFDNNYISLNVYHFLVDNLILTKESKHYQLLYCKFIKDSEEYQVTDTENFIDHLITRGISQADNYIVGDKPKSVNTYNHESLLSQSLQYIIFYNGDKYFIILQIHNGCDIRGGYTVPKIFEIEDIDIFIVQQDHCSVTTKKARYYTEDTYNFYFDELVDKEPKQDKMFEDSPIRDNKTYTYEELFEEGIVWVSE